jgi:hypothetical protein
LLSSGNASVIQEFFLFVSERTDDSITPAQYCHCYIAFPCFTSWFSCQSFIYPRKANTNIIDKYRVAGSKYGSRGGGKETKKETEETSRDSRQDMTSNGSLKPWCFSVVVLVAIQILLVAMSCGSFVLRPTTKTHRHSSLTEQRDLQTQSIWKGVLPTVISPSIHAEQSRRGLVGMSVSSNVEQTPSARKNMFQKTNDRGKEQAPQLLKFREPTTNVTVILIGAMHYNPSSIQLTRFTLEDLKAEKNLGAVIIESCDLRWTSGANSTEKEPDEEELRQRQKMSKFLENEMRTAYDVAHGLTDNDLVSPTSNLFIPVVLGDQRINITTTRMKEVAQQTFVDLATPFSGGWENFYTDMRHAMSLALPNNDDKPVGINAHGDESTSTTSTMPPYINARGFLDAGLLLAMPVTLVKYPLSWMIRAPLGTAIATTLFVVLNYIADHTTGPTHGLMSAMASTPDMAPAIATAASAASLMSSGEASTSDLVYSLAFAILEVAVLGRILVKALLAERNEVLADNILHQCRLLAKQQKRKQSPWWQTLFQPEPSLSNMDDTMTTYYAMPPPLDDRTSRINGDAYGSAAAAISRMRKLKSVVKEVPRNNDTIRKSSVDIGDDPVVVAVLGMAHCNGIMKLMLEGEN